MPGYDEQISISQRVISALRGGAKVYGILGLLVVLCLYTAFASANPWYDLTTSKFLNAANLESLVHRTALYGILGIGVAFVIITGGIDLSIGSVVCIVGVILPWLLTGHEWPVAGALLVVLSLSCLIGLFHGLLVTKMRLQPFVVTLCGLLAFRGVARGLTGDQSQGFGIGFKGLRSLATGRIPIFGSGPDVFQLPGSSSGLSPALPLLLLLATRSFMTFWMLPTALVRVVICPARLRMMLSSPLFVVGGEMLVALEGSGPDMEPEASHTMTRLSVAMMLALLDCEPQASLLVDVFPAKGESPTLKALTELLA